MDEEDIDKYMLNALSDSSEDDEDTDINDGNDSKTIQVPKTIPREENTKKNQYNKSRNYLKRKYTL